jgi:hypothetical protein
MSNNQFKADLTKFIAKAGVNAQLVVTKIALDLDRSLILKSPVDTGRFRGNWQVSFDRANTETKESTDKSGQSTINAHQAALAEFKAGRTVFLTNSLPYALAIEYGQYGRGPGATDKTTRDGFSIQAPYGVRDLTVAEFKFYVQKAVRGLK